MMRYSWYHFRAEHEYLAVQTIGVVPNHLVKIRSNPVCKTDTSYPDWLGYQCIGLAFDNLSILISSPVKHLFASWYFTYAAAVQERPSSWQISTFFWTIDCSLKSVLYSYNQTISKLSTKKKILFFKRKIMLSKFSKKIIISWFFETKKVKWNSSVQWLVYRVNTHWRFSKTSGDPTSYNSYERTSALQNALVGFSCVHPGVHIQLWRTVFHNIWNWKEES